MNRKHLTFKNQPKSIKAIFCIYAISFIFGGLRHWLDILNGGILPYEGIPLLFNVYLTSLAVFDLVVVCLIFIRPLSGLGLAILIMSSDLVIDFYLTYRYWHVNFLENRALQLLLIFGIFLFITAPTIMRKSLNRTKYLQKSKPTS